MGASTVPLAISFPPGSTIRAARVSLSPLITDEDFKKCIANGVRKINYYTYLAKAGGMYVKEKCRAAEEYVFFHDVTQWAVQAMKEDVLHTIRVFSHLE